MYPIQQLESLQLGAADAERLKKLVALLRQHDKPTLEQIFFKLFPLVDENKAKAQFRQLLHAINGAIRAQGLTLTITTGNKHQALNQRTFNLHQNSPIVDLQFEEFSVAASYATAREAYTVQQLATISTTKLIYFVSYAHADDKVAKSFYQQLKTQLGPWQDIDFMPWQDGMLELGQDFREQIVQALSESHCGILLYSPAFFKSTFILLEELPKLLSKPYFAPVLLKPILYGQIPDLLNNPQYFRFKNKAYNDFIASKDKEAFAQAFAEKFASEALTKYKVTPHITNEPESRQRSDYGFDNIQLEEKNWATWRAKTDLLGEAAPNLDNDDNSDKNAVVALDNLMDWFQDAQQPAYATVLAEYGMGKTTLCQSLVLQAKQRREQGEDLPPIIYFDLRNLHQRDELATVSIDTIITALITGNWQNAQAPRFDAAQVLQAVREDTALLIFDGLDEVLTTVDNTTGEQFLRTIWSTLPLHHVASRRKQQQPVGKLLLTCRSHYFPTVTKEQHFYTGQSREGIRDRDYHVLWLLPLTAWQIELYIEQNFAEQSQRIKEVIAQVHKLSDLAKRPLNLRYITELWPRLKQRKARQGKPLLAADFYHEMLEQVLMRDGGKAQFSNAHKRELLEALAAGLWRSGLRSWAVEELEDWAKEYIFNNPRWLRDYGLIAAKPKDIQHRLEELTEDLRSAMLIVREGEKYFRFAHTSIQEFALAAYLHRALCQEKSQAWVMPLPSLETLDFLGELLQGENQTQALATLKTLTEQYLVQASELLFHYALRAHQRGYPCISLRSCQLQGAQLKHLRLPLGSTVFDVSHADFSGADLSHSQLFGLRCEGALFNHADLSYSEWHQGYARASRFQFAKMQVCVFRDMDLRLANFDHALAQAAEWRRCDLDGMSFATVQGDFDTVACRVQGVVQADIKTKPETLRLEVALRHTHIYYCAYSPNGRQLASASRDHTVKIWDTTSGALLLTLSGHGDKVNYCVYSPDGRQLASAPGDGTVKLWDTVSGALLFTLSGHVEEVNHCAYSPDGKQLASASDDGTVKLWDTFSGVLLLTLSGHGGEVNHCAYSPDGRKLASSSSDDGTVKLWDTVSGALLLTLSGHGTHVKHLIYLHDGKQLACASNNDTIKLWDVTTGALLSALSGHRSDFYPSEYSPDGSQRAKTIDFGVIELWDATSETLQLTLPPNRGYVFNFTYSPDGKQLACAYANGTIIFWDTSNGNSVLTSSWKSYRINYCDFSPDGRQLASASDDGSVKLWDTASGALVLTLSGNGSQVDHDSYSTDDDSEHYFFSQFKGRDSDFVNHCEFSSNGRQLASASDDGSVKLWDTASGALLLTSSRRRGSLYHHTYSPDGKQLAHNTADGSIKLWDTASGALLLTLSANNSQADYDTNSAENKESFFCYKIDSYEIDSYEIDSKAAHFAYSPDGRELASASDDGSIKIWDTTSGALLLTLPGHSRRVNNCAYSPDGRQLASAYDDDIVKIWDTFCGSLLLTLSLKTSQDDSKTYMPDGRPLSVWMEKRGYSDNTTEQEEFSFMGTKKGSNICSFSPDGSQLVCESRDSRQSLCFWDTVSGALLFTLWGYSWNHEYCVYSPDGRQLACANGRTVQLWDMFNGTLLFSLLGHGSAVNQCAYSPDGKQLASASSDHTIKLWNTANGALLFTLLGHTGGISYCCFSADGLTLLSAGGDSMRLWRVSDGKALRVFYHLAASFSAQPQYLSLANAETDVTELAEHNISDNWQVVDHSDEAWRFVFWRGQDQHGHLRRWPYEFEG